MGEHAWPDYCKKETLAKRLNLAVGVIDQLVKRNIGLRKSAVVMMLEAGCSEAETASVTGQTLAMVAHYGKQVNQSHLAAAAILKWEERERNRN